MTVRDGAPQRATGLVQADDRLQHPEPGFVGLAEDDIDALPIKPSGVLAGSEEVLRTGRVGKGRAGHHELTGHIAVRADDAGAGFLELRLVGDRVARPGSAGDSVRGAPP